MNSSKVVPVLTPVHLSLNHPARYPPPSPARSFAQAADPYASQPGQPLGSFAGLSLWLVPAEAGAQRSTLKREMEALRSTVPDASESFEPHVTLLAGLTSQDGWTQDKVWQTSLDALKSWGQQQDEKLGSIDCELLDVTTRGSFFQVRA